MRNLEELVYTMKLKSVLEIVNLLETLTQMME